MLGHPRGPLNPSCEDKCDPEVRVGPCQFHAMDRPDGWRMPDFDDDGWASAVKYSEHDARPKDGCDQIDWNNEAQLIWPADLARDNTLLRLLTVERPRMHVYMSHPCSAHSAHPCGPGGLPAIHGRCYMTRSNEVMVYATRRGWTFPCPRNIRSMETGRE